MSTLVIPQTYEEWHHCITVICQQKLTLPYIEARIKSLNSPNDSMTQKFIELYGDQQRLKTLQWFKQAMNETQ